MLKTILVVDDSAAIRQMLHLLLQSAGYQVIEAIDGADGVQKAMQQSVDLVLSDFNMPHMDGLALVQALRNTAVHKTTPILLLTTESTPALKQQGKSAGATGWITKPFLPERLLEVVHNVLN